MFFSVFLAWLCKTLVLRYGGPALYLKTRPFFMGLILGQFVTARHLVCHRLLGRRKRQRRNELVV